MSSYDDMYYYGNKQMKTKYKKILFWIILVLFAVIGIVGGVFYTTFTAFSTKPETIKSSLSQHELANNKTDIYFYQPGCSDCKSVRWQVLGDELFSGNTKTKYINVNTQDPANQKYVKRFAVNETPTMVSVRSGLVTNTQVVTKK